MQPPVYYISRIKFRGFKSFKNAEVTLPRGFVALAGPNGSGKSNVTDAIRFCLGEMSLKSLRAKRVSELINQNSSKAEVVLNIEGDRPIEIRRAINDEGKTSYNMDGRHLTRVQVLEALRPCGLEVGTHNIIAQGQVQQIVQMNAKERRAIIDQAAGIAEFDDKKKEALGELGKVATKISEANIVLSERKAYLSELEKERDAALAFIEAQTSLSRARATLVHGEYERINNHFEELLKKRAAVLGDIEKLGAEMRVLSERQTQLEAQRLAIAAKISKGSEREKLLASIQGMQVELAGLAARLEEKEKDKARLEAEEKELTSQAERLESGAADMEKELGQMRKAGDAARLTLEQAKSKAGIVEEGAGEKGELVQLQDKLNRLLQDKAGAEAGLEKTKEMKAAHEGEVARLEAEIGKLQSSGGEEDDKAERFANSIKALSVDLEKLFEEEKKLNKSIPDLDRKLLEAKETVATLRGAVSPASQNPALLTVNQMKKDGQRGIYGTVAELIQVDNEHRTAVEAAAGGRLVYVVVDMLDTANVIITKLKESKAGRATFIPLDRPVRSDAGEILKAPEGALGKLIDFVDYDKGMESAMRFVFEDTLLVQNVAAAKKIGTGRYRMVTLDGELLERSGIISGGSMRGSLMARASLEKAEGMVEGIKAERDALYAKVYEVREEMQRRRRERAEAEVKLRTLEAERGGVGERKVRMRAAGEEKARWEQQAKGAHEEERELAGKLEKLETEEKKLASEVSALRAAQDEQTKAKQKASASARTQYEQALEDYSNRESALKGRSHELEMMRAQKVEFAQKGAAAKAAAKAAKKEMDAMREAQKAKAAECEAQEAHLREVSGAVQKYYDQMQGLQKELDELGAASGKIKFAWDGKQRESHELEVKRASAETKLTDLKVEWEKHAGTPLLEVGKDKLEEMIRESEVKLRDLGMVNQKAPEMYEQRKKEIEEVATRVQTLESEKGAVMGLIAEIEQKKRQIFLDTFKVVNEHFGKLFAMVYPGEASLVLEMPENPLESGLQIRVRGVSDKKERYLSSMSGGEMTLIALMFIFALQMHKPAPFYILDEAEAALDKENARKFAGFVKQMSGRAQFIVVTHNDAILSSADVVLGVTRTNDGSKIVGVQLTAGSPFLGGKMPPGEPPKPDGGAKGTGSGGKGGAPSFAIPAPGQKSASSGLANPAREVAELVVAKKSKKA